MADGIKNWYVLVALILVSFLVYFNSLGNSFHFDDYHHIVENPHIKDVRNIPSFFIDIKGFSKKVGHNHYRPMLMVTYALNYYYGRLTVIGYHLVNLAFHAGSGFLVFLIVQAMLGTGYEKVFFSALTSALIFTVNPFNSEVVNYITARSSVMVSFFYLLAFYCWVKYRENPPVSPFYKGGNRGIFYIASLIAFLLGLLTKENAITLPVVIWIYDLYFVYVSDDRKIVSLVEHVRRLTVYIPFILFAAVPYLIIRGSLIAGSFVSRVGPVRSYYVNLLTQLTILPKYIKMFFAPVNLSIDHVVRDILSFWEWKVMAATGFLLGVIVFGLWLYKNRDRAFRVVSFFLIWFFVILLPTIIIPLTSVLQENRGYLSGMGLAVVTGVLFGKVARVRIYVYIAVTGILIAILSLLTVHRNSVWKDELTIWTDAARKYPSSARAYYAFATLHRRNGDFEKSIESYRKVLQIDPTYFEAHNGIALIYYRDEKLDLAIEEFKKALNISPSYIYSRIGLGKVYMKKGEMGMAKEEFRTALAIARFTNRDKDADDVIHYLEWIDGKVTGERGRND